MFSWVRRFQHFPWLCFEQWCCCLWLMLQQLSGFSEHWGCLGMRYYWWRWDVLERCARIWPCWNLLWDPWACTMVCRKSSILVLKVLINLRWHLRLLIHAFYLHHLYTNFRDEVDSGCCRTANVRTSWGPRLCCHGAALPCIFARKSPDASQAQKLKPWEFFWYFTVSFLQSITGEDTKCLRLN